MNFQQTLFQKRFVEEGEQPYGAIESKTENHWNKYCGKGR